MSVKAVPDNYGTVTPYLSVHDAAGAIDWYKNALGAEEICRMPGPVGKVMHAEIKIGTSVVMLSDEIPEMSGSKSPRTLGGTPVSMHMYVDDVDKVYEKAVSAGATGQMPPADMFWGDRFGKFADPFGHEWSVATHKEDLTPAEMDKRQAEFMAQAGAGPL